MLSFAEGINDTYGTEGTGSRRGEAPPLLTGLHGPGSMAARSFFPAERPKEELSLLASFLGVLPAEKSSSEQQLYSSTRSSKAGPASLLSQGEHKRINR